jgi:exopolysaccharide production protein ExoQ
MPPPLALALTLLLIGYLIRRDGRVAPRPSPAVWIPTLWLLINGSRQVSQWFASGPQFAAQALHEGNPIDQVVYGALILAGILVIARRGIQIHSFARFNTLIFVFLGYEAVSILWSDYPFLTFKRWIKASGDFVMILVIGTDRVPVRAITATIKRSGYILIPLSLLFCKYYPELGRAFNPWDGSSFNVGVTLDKNMFGYLLFAYGLFYFSVLVRTFDKKTPGFSPTHTDKLSTAFLLFMIAWMTPMADSKTSQIALVAGVMLVVAFQVPSVKRNALQWILGTVLAVAVLNVFFSLENTVIEASGRDATLTGRTGIWKTVLSVPNSVLFGTGYASFWLGDRLQYIWDVYPNTPLLQAHNGYIELYLNLGLIGVAILCGVLWTGLRNTQRRMTAPVLATTGLDERTYQTFGMAFVPMYILYNITESTFMGLNFLFIIFLLVAFEFSRFKRLNGSLKGPRLVS